MVGVLVVPLIRSSIFELHREPEPVAVLRTYLVEQLERLDAGDGREALRGLEEVTLLRRSLPMGECERNGVPDAVRNHPRRLLRDDLGERPADDAF